MTPAPGFPIRGIRGSLIEEPVPVRRRTAFTTASIAPISEFAADVTEIAIEEIPQFANAKYRELWTGGSPGSVELSLFFLE